MDFDVADDDCLSFGQGAPGVLRTVGIACMEYDPMALARQQFPRHQAEARGRAGNEDARHDFSPLGGPPNW